MTAVSPLAQSVQTRLVRAAKDLHVDPNLVFSRYAAERLLHRLAQSHHAERFVLEGAMMLVVWLGDIIRPTRNVDLLGFGDLSDEAVLTSLKRLRRPTSSIREEDAHGGRRVMLSGHLGSVRRRVQIDIGIGDAVFPDPEWIEYPSLLDLPTPKLKAYRPETAIAEKLHAMVTLGSKNSRMRDFFDIRALARGAEPFGPSEATSCRPLTARAGGARSAVASRRTPGCGEVAVIEEIEQTDGRCRDWRRDRKQRRARSWSVLGQSTEHARATFEELPR